MRIAISGTPGTGKTVISKKLSEKMKYTLIELNKEIKKHKLYQRRLQFKQQGIRM